MGSEISNDVRRIGVHPRAHDPRLPDPAGKPFNWQKPILDRIGESVRERPWTLGAGAVMGIGTAITGSKMLGRGLPTMLLSGTVLAVTGALTVGWVASHVNDRISSDSASGPKLDAPKEHVVADEQLKVMTYNIRGNMGATGYGTSESKMQQVADRIKKERPDIVVLQEVDDFAIRSSFRDNLADLNRVLKPDSIVSADTGRLLTGRSEATAVMTFNGARITDARNWIHADPEGAGPIRRGRGQVGEWYRSKPVREHNLPKLEALETSYSPANTLDAMVRTPEGNDVRVLTGHYHASNRFHDYLDMQVGEMAKQIGAWKGATIYGADFNTQSSDGHGKRERDWLNAAGLEDTFTKAGVRIGDDSRISTVADHHEIDRIYVPASATVTDSHVVQEKSPASDHRPVVASIQLHKEI